MGQVMPCNQAPEGLPWYSALLLYYGVPIVVGMLDCNGTCVTYGGPIPSGLC
jgi:hypothetical protein